jgi:NAD(P)-dependent dehydrogenase (short-subunit alcohol dehydrogenase family)
MNTQGKAMTGKVAIVTGASSGIGRATARAFADAGAAVVLADVQVAPGEEFAREIQGMGGRALFVKCDVSRQADVETLVQKSVSQFGRIDYAFNNAGVEGTPAPSAECTEENFDRTIAINLKGVWLCMKHELQQMLKQGGGTIVNCSSVAGLVGFAGIPAYTASKHGVIGLTKAAALEYAKTGIRVNAVCPGVIETPMVSRFTKNDPNNAYQLIAGEPVGRMGRPEEIAKAVLWLCSGDASFVTGATLAVDGGWVAQ